MTHIVDLQQTSTQAELAATTGLEEALAIVAPELEKFLTTRAEGPDPTVTQRHYWLEQLNEPMPNIGIGKQAVLEKLARDVIPYGARIGAPGFCRNITTAPTIVPAVTQFVASLAGPQREWNHAFNYLEYSALQWLAQLMGLDPKIYQGIFSDGGSSANLICLIAARQAAFEKLGIDPAMDGVAGIPRPTLYTSDQVTGILHRQVAIMGFGRRALVTVPSNEDFRLDVEALRERIHADIAEGCMPIAVVATAGTTNSGAIDPLADIAELCHRYQLWFHVDGAYGLPAIVDKRVASLYAGLEYADSLVLDPHKWFAIPVGCGAAFVRNKQILPRAFALGPAPFLVLEKPVGDEDDEEQFEMQSITSPFATWGKEYGDRGNASSAPSRGVSVWALFQEIGIEGLRERISRHITFARDLAWLIEQSECLQNMGSNPPPLSICSLRYRPPEWQGREKELSQQLDTLNRRVLEKMCARNRYIPSSTTIHGSFVIRPCFINPRMDREDVKGFFDEVVACGDEAWTELQMEYALSC